MKRFFALLGAASFIGALTAANLGTQARYAGDSVGQRWDLMLDRLHHLADLKTGTPIRIGLQSYPETELTALYARGHPAWNLGGAMFVPAVLWTAKELDGAWRAGDLPETAEPLRRVIMESSPLLSFDLGPDGPSHRYRRFEPPGGTPVQAGVVVLPARDGSVVNGSQDRPDAGLLYAAPYADLRDTLVQVDSSLGHIVTPGLLDNVGLWPHQGDFSGGAAGLQGVGRNLLFEVLNPVPGSRLLLDFTSGGLASQDVPLPPAVLYGTDRQSLGFAGHGAARLISEPITPREIGGHYYIALDMGMDALQFATPRQGLAALYNSQLSLDSRKMVGYARNISLLTPEQAAALAPPANVPNFPGGLFAPGLLFSGVSEDGWLADEAWFVLGAVEPADTLHIRGEIFGFSAKILSGTFKVSVDGALVASGKLAAGAVDIVAPISAKAGPRRVLFEVSGADRLSPPDARRASIHLKSIALERGPQAGSDGAPSR